MKNSSFQIFRSVALALGLVFGLFFAGQARANYIDGANLYEGYFAERAGMDPSGMWKLDSGNIYVAEKDGETLGELAVKVGANAADSDCIWVVGDWKDPSKYPTASKCDKADVSNLVATSGVSYERIITRQSEWSMRRIRGVVGNISYTPAGDIYSEIKNISGQGSTPIRYLMVFGHGAGEFDMYDSGTKSKFSNLDFVPSSNTYLDAQKNRGPCKCWFTRNSNLWFWGCSTSSFARQFANEIIRDGATAHGTDRTVWVEYLFPGVHWSHRPFGGSTNYYGDWKNAPIWKSYNGRQ